MEKFECDKCKGKGDLGITLQTESGHNLVELCDKCDGNGYLDWIENVRGKKPKRFPFQTLMMEIEKEEIKEILKSDVEDD